MSCEGQLGKVGSHETLYGIKVWRLDGIAGRGAVARFVVFAVVVGV